MNIVIDDDFIGTKFGPFLQLTVIGWDGHKSYYNKKYTVECSICKEDTELYGDGRFLITKNKIRAGRIPCGCSVSTQWTQAQWKIRIKRECAIRGYKFIAHDPTTKGKNGYCYLESPSGEIDCVIINNFIKGQDTKSLWKKKISVANTKPVEDHIEKFMKTGAFAEGTTFEKCLDKVDHQGWKTWWKVSCPTCGESYFSLLSNLNVGSVGCSCSQRRHKRSYIHVISNDSGILAIKFGITSMLTNRRMFEQAKKSGLYLEEFGLWEYSEVSSCRRAEREVKKIFSNYLNRDVFPDGYTETTEYGNVEYIVTIFESNGGVRIR